MNGPANGLSDIVRIALYSHDALGLGHLRRNLAIARALARTEGASTLLVTGMREAAAFPAPEGVDYLTLPGFAKDASGAYHARFLKTSARRLAALRADTMRAALEAYAPDVLIVDKHPLGLFDELVPALDALAEQGARCVLGLRDVLDRPDRTLAEWRAAGSEQAVRERYDAVWVYGDPRVYDVVRECGLGEIVAEKTRFSGYLGTGREVARDAEPAPDLGELPEGRLALCLVGGGQDGFALADAFGRAPIPRDTTGVVVTGPLMPARLRDRLERSAGPRVRVVGFTSEPAPLIERADVVVAMGGYNTTCELLARDKRALIVPRVHPRQEQLIRARRLEQRGLVDVLHPTGATPGALGGWLDMRGPRPAAGPIDLDGLHRLPGLLSDAMEAETARAA